jgi:putative membrane protein
MAIDLILAVLHHVLAFGLVSHLMAEAVLLRMSLDQAQIARMAGLDRAYGLSAVALVVVGILRVVFGAKGSAYYVENPWFWAKMASFAAVGLLSIWPTVRILAWRRASRTNPSFSPTRGEVTAVRRFLHAEAGLIVLILACAAAMARFG